MTVEDLRAEGETGMLAQASFRVLGLKYRPLLFDDEASHREVASG